MARQDKQTHIAEEAFMILHSGEIPEVIFHSSLYYLTEYRGLARCAANWQRWLKFCSRENLDFVAIQGETAEALQTFLKQEVAEAESRIRPSSINCSCREIENLAKSLGISPDDLPEGWQKLCPGNAE
jgi:hypothetical protein